MTWLLFLKYLRIAGLWCRQHWRWLVLFMGFVIVYLLGRRHANSLRIQANMAKETYLKEKQAIEEAHQLEIQKREEANKRYSEAVKKIEAEHEKNKKEITRTKKEEIKRMVDKAKHSPEEIDRILEQEMGIQKG